MSGIKPHNISYRLAPLLISYIVFFPFSYLIVEQLLLNQRKIEHCLGRRASVVVRDRETVNLAEEPGPVSVEIIRLM